MDRVLACKAIVCRSVTYPELSKFPARCQYTAGIGHAREVWFSKIMIGMNV